MERIRELLTRLASLTAEELDELRGLIVTEFDDLDGQDVTPEVVASQNELAEIGEQVHAEMNNRAAAQAQAEQDRVSAQERVRALRDPEPEAETPEAEQAVEQPDAEAETPAEEQPAEQVAVTASVPAPRQGVVRRMAAAQAGRTPQPGPEVSAADERRRAVLTASAAMRDLRPGAAIDDRSEFFSSMADTLRRMNKTGPARGDVLLASASWEYPEERRLTDDAWRNSEIINRAVGSDAILASGGTCLPVNVDYAVPVWASADRPIRDALPAFQATRGGLRYVTPPDIGSWSAATAVWSEATDANPGGATKPVVVMSCASEQLVYVDAIPTRIGFGNMQGRFAPEQVAANTDLAIAAAARVAENNLLAKIQAVSLQAITTAKGLGAARDLVSAIEQFSAQYRYAHRLPDSVSITAIFPRWLRDMLKIDLAREAAHQQDSSWNSLAISDQQIDDLISAHGVRPVWHMDGQASESVHSVSIQTQGFTEASAGAALTAFPTNTVWYAFAEGMVQFLDGGRLDLGVVRDSTLDATNDYETFVETFEGIANRGFTNGVYQIVSTLCANGQSSAAAAFTTCA